MIKAHKNPSSAPWLSIPIRNGAFEYDFYTDQEEVYEVFIWNDMINGSWMPAFFFAENGPVSFTLYPASTGKPGVTRTKNPLTCELQQLETERNNKFNFDSLYAQIDKLYKENNVEERNKIYRERDRLEESGEAYTEDAKVLLEEIKQLNQKMNQWTIERIKQHPSLIGLYVLTSKIAIARKGEDISPYLSVYQNIFASRYPEHPYSKEMKILIENGQPKIGNPYIDF